MVALDEDVVFYGPAAALGGAGGAFGFDVFLNEFIVEMDGNEAGIFENLPVLVQAGSSEFNDHFLPFTCGLGSVDERRMTFEALGVTFVIPAMVDCSHITVSRFFFTMTIEDLDFVTALKIDA